MKLEGEFVIPAPVTDVYSALMDPHRVVRWVPNILRYEVQNEDHFTITMRVGIGHFKGPITMNFERVETVAPKYTKLVGKGSMAGGKVNVQGSFQLEDLSGDSTRVTWVGDAKLSRILTVFAGGALDLIVRNYAEQFAQAMKSEMAS